MIPYPQSGVVVKNAMRLLYHLKRGPVNRNPLRSGGSVQMYYRVHNSIIYFVTRRIV